MASQKVSLLSLRLWIEAIEGRGDPCEPPLRALQGGGASVTRPPFPCGWSLAPLRQWRLGRIEVRGDLREPVLYTTVTSEWLRDEKIRM